MRAAAIGTVLLGPLLLGACNTDPTGLEFAPFDGTWVGSIAEVDLVLVVQEDEVGNVAGTGGISREEMSLPFTLVGAHDHPAVRFTALTTDGDELRFDGRFAAVDSVEGAVDGLGIEEGRLSLVRSD